MCMLGRRRNVLLLWLILIFIVNHSFVMHRRDSHRIPVKKHVFHSVSYTRIGNQRLLSRLFHALLYRIYIRVIQCRMTLFFCYMWFAIIIEKFTIHNSTHELNAKRILDWIYNYINGSGSKRCVCVCVLDTWTIKDVNYANFELLSLFLFCSQVN